MSIERKNLEVQVNRSAKKMITIDPLNFSVGAWREILMRQIYCVESREIIVAKRERVAYIPSSSIRNARTMLKPERRAFVDDLAKLIQSSDAVIIQQPKDEE